MTIETINNIDIDLCASKLAKIDANKNNDKVDKLIDSLFLSYPNPNLISNLENIKIIQHGNKLKDNFIKKKLLIVDWSDNHYIISLA